MFIGPRPKRNLCESSPASFPLPVRVSFLPPQVKSPLILVTSLDGMSLEPRVFIRSALPRIVSVSILQGARAEPPHSHPPLRIRSYSIARPPWHVALGLPLILTFLFLELTRGHFGLHFTTTPSGFRTYTTFHRDCCTNIGVLSIQGSFYQLNGRCLMTDTAFRHTPGLNLRPR